MTCLDIYSRVIDAEISEEEVAKLRNAIELDENGAVTLEGFKKALASRTSVGSFLKGLFR